MINTGQIMLCQKARILLATYTCYLYPTSLLQGQGSPTILAVRRACFSRLARTRLR